MHLTHDATLNRGMVLTIEPGLYLPEQFGVRIESVGVVVACPEDATLSCFDVITRVPISPKLVEPSMLTDTEKKWLNDFNAKCLTTRKPLLTEASDEFVLRYLEKECSPLE